MANVEHVMTFAGVGLAASAATFAVVATLSNDGTPKISGQEHLALFARPSMVREQRSASTAPPAAVRSAAPEALDYAPTATIRNRQLLRVRVLRRDGDFVILAGPGGPLQLRPGDSVPGLGRLADIRLLGDQWIALFAAGDTALTVRDMSAAIPRR